MNFSVLIGYCDLEVKWFERFRILSLVLQEDFSGDLSLKKKGFSLSKPAPEM